MKLIAVLGRTYGVICHLLSLERYDIIAEGILFVKRFFAEKPRKIQFFIVAKLTGTAYNDSVSKVDRVIILN